MIRSRQYIGIRRRVVRYSSDEWASTEFRTNALAAARDEAKAIRGEIIIKVRYDRALVTMAKIRYVESRNGFNTYYRPNSPR